MKIFKNKGRKKCIKNDYFTSIIALEFTISPLIISVTQMYLLEQIGELRVKP